MSVELAACLVTLFLLAGIGTPIGYSILLASIVYLSAGGLDVALAGEKILQGLYNSFVLLAVPLFIVAANIMNAGTISERLLIINQAELLADVPLAQLEQEAKERGEDLERVVLDIVQRRSRDRQEPAGEAEALKEGAGA